MSNGFSLQRTAPLISERYGISPGWYEVGRFLGGSIRDFDERWPVRRLVEVATEAGFKEVRARRLSLGGCTVLWGRRA